MNRPKRSDNKYWEGTRNFNHIQYETDLEDYIDEQSIEIIKISGVSKNLTFYIQWITGLLTVKYGITKVNNLEVATEIVKFVSSDHGYLNLKTDIDKKALNDFKDAWQKLIKTRKN